MLCAACPAQPMGELEPVANGTGIGGRALQCKPVLNGLTVMQPSSQMAAAGLSRDCNTCLDTECLARNQRVYGTDAGGFGGLCGEHLSCLCTCKGDFCVRDCMRSYDVDCQRAVSALEQCRQDKCSTRCSIPALLTLEFTLVRPDAGPLVEQACRSPNLDGGTPCCDAFLRCCRGLVDGGMTACTDTWGMSRRSEGTCAERILDWSQQCPGVMP